MERRLAHVDGLRAIAVLGVLLWHIRLFGPDQSWLRDVLYEGQYGVDLFFVLSGFCLAVTPLRLLHEGRKTSFDLPDFFARRIVRIAPPFVVTVALLAGYSVLARSLALPVAGPAADVGQIVRQLFFLDRNTTLLTSPFWTLMIEARWYLWFPLALLICTWSARALALGAVLIAVSFFATLALGIDGIAAPGFIFGVLAANALVRGTVSRRALYVLLTLGAIVEAAFQFGPAQLTIRPLYEAGFETLLTGSRFGWQLIACAVLLLVTTTPAWRRILGWPPLAAIGLASYSIYLTHEPLLRVLLGAGVLAQHGALAMTLAALLGLIPGFALWALCEHPFTQGRLHGPAIAAVRRGLRRLFDALRIPATFELHAAREPVPLDVPAPQPDLLLSP